jgi:hypothetical protein
MEQPSSGTLILKRLETQKIENKILRFCAMRVCFPNEIKQTFLKPIIV